jgi:hypothetical protein
VQLGVLGLLGYILSAVADLSMLGTEYVAALVLPSIAHRATLDVNHVIAVANNRPSAGDIGLMRPAILFTGSPTSLAASSSASVSGRGDARRASTKAY